LDEDFIKQWGDRRDYLYYITEFGDLRRKSGESVSDFTKRFNKMYNKIPDEIKPTEASTKITFANSFDGASHNVMPKVVMEELGLEITKPYQDLYSFDSKKVKCLGLIKYLVVSLSQLPMKSVVMDIVVADIPPKFGMLLSRTWAKKVGGSLQMDLTYATIPVFGGEHRRLYREVILAYIVSDHQNPGNHPIYVVEDEIGSSIFHINDDAPEISVNKCRNQPLTDQGNEVWKMYFDGSSSKEGLGLV
jgi:hypothetical protein